jgi:hypothetical protein
MFTGYFVGGKLLNISPTPVTLHLLLGNKKTPTFIGVS